MQVELIENKHRGPCVFVAGGSWARGDAVPVGRQLAAFRSAQSLLHGGLISAPLGN